MNKDVVEQVLEEFEQDSLTPWHRACVDAGAIIFATNMMKPVVVSVNNRQVIVRWKDGTVNRATCSSDDNFDLEVGFAVCLLKHVYRHKAGKALLEKILMNVRINTKEKKKGKKK
jgi:hypothetical protein